jgi:hypothetical protein
MHRRLGDSPPPPGGPLGCHRPLEMEMPLFYLYAQAAAGCQRPGALASPPAGRGADPPPPKEGGHWAYSQPRGGAQKEAPARYRRCGGAVQGARRAQLRSPSTHAHGPHGPTRQRLRCGSRLLLRRDGWAARLIAQRHCHCPSGRLFILGSSSRGQACQGGRAGLLPSGEVWFRYTPCPLPS